MLASHTRTPVLPRCCERPPQKQKQNKTHREFPYARRGVEERKGREKKNKTRAASRAINAAISSSLRRGEQAGDAAAKQTAAPVVCEKITSRVPLHLAGGRQRKPHPVICVFYAGRMVRSRSQCTTSNAQTSRKPVSRRDPSYVNVWREGVVRFFVFASEPDGSCGPCAGHVSSPLYQRRTTDIGVPVSEHGRRALLMKGKSSRFRGSLFADHSDVGIEICRIRRATQ